MNKSNKGILILLIVLIVICLAGGGLGLFKNLNTTNDIDKTVEYTITYEYYLDGEVVSKMPTNAVIPEVDNTDETDETTETQIEPLYSFQSYTCTNRVTGSWDNDKWEFTPNKTSDAKCLLYFTSNYFTVDVTAINGTVNVLEALGTRTVKREETINFNITPTEGYKYDSVTCTNDATGTWDEEKTTLTVSEVTKNTTCEITFIKDEYSVEVVVNNGSVTGERKVTAEYNQEVVFTVTPSSGHKDYKINCSNNQTATYNASTNKLTVSKITKETTCTINFSPIKYTVKLNVVNGTTHSTNPQEINPNTTAAFVIAPAIGFTKSNPEISCTNSQEAAMDNDILKVETVTQDTECTITLKREESSTE